MPNHDGALGVQTDNLTGLYIPGRLWKRSFPRRGLRTHFMLVRAVPSAQQAFREQDSEGTVWIVSVSMMAVDFPLSWFKTACPSP